MFMYLTFVALITSTLIVLTTSSWFTAWVGFELNLLSFLPIMYSYDQMNAEAMMKYFFIQASGSILLFMSGTLNLSASFTTTSVIQMTDLLLLAMFLKLGMFPMYFWFPAIIEGLGWLSLVILLTWQKIAPLSLITNMYPEISKLLMFLSLSSAIIGMLGGLNQLYLRKILAYSSITHLSWMAILTMTSLKTLYLYLLMYFTLTSMILLIFWAFNLIHMTQITTLNSTNPLMTMMTFLSLFSLGGMPPFLGFLPKWLAITSFLSSNLFMVTSILVMTSVLTLFFYIRICYQSLTLSYSIFLWPSQTPTKPLLSLITLTTITFLPTALFVFH